MSQHLLHTRKSEFQKDESYLHILLITKESHQKKVDASVVKFGLWYQNMCGIYI